jgi:hypothetical protein
MAPPEWQLRSAELARSGVLLLERPQTGERRQHRAWLL